MLSSKPIRVRRVNRLTKNADQRREDHCYEALAFSWHNIDVVFDDENMALENAGIDPSTMRVSKWYKESTRKDVDSRVSEVVTGTRKSSCQAREPVENVEERLALKMDDMLPPMQKRVDNLRIREDQALPDSFRTQTGYSVLPLKTLTHKHGLNTADLPSHNLLKRRVQTLSCTTCQRTSAVFSSTIRVPSIRRVNSENHRT